LPDTTSGLDLAGQRGSETVLVVEHEEAVRDLTAMMLRYLGYDVLTEWSGDATIEIGRAHTGTIALW
jgi:CheY-like chemotaxis protein